MESQESSDDTFHCDSSNQDNSDDDLLYDTNVDKDLHDASEKSSASDSTVYADSDDERMACNSTDDENTRTDPVFLSYFIVSIVLRFQVNVLIGLIKNLESSGLCLLLGQHLAVICLLTIIARFLIAASEN